MLDTAGSWRVTAQESPPAERLVLGRPVAEAREMIGRVFNLCREAQLAAFDLATGAQVDTTAATAEIRRDHLAQIFMAWPRALGLPPVFDRRWLEEDKMALIALFGADGRVPGNDFDMAGYLGSDRGAAPFLRLIGEIFGPRTATADDIPLVDAESAFGPAPVENSPAARQAAHPAMDYVEAMYGRGPMWRAVGRVMDLAAILSGNAPRPLHVGKGTAIVPATRGYYALNVETADGQVTALNRTTPTDHLLCPGGALETLLTRLPAHRAELIPLLMTLVDPCRGVNVEGARDA